MASSQNENKGQSIRLIHSNESSSNSPPPPLNVSFDRGELSHILNVYGRKVSNGEWRDYAIDMLKDRAVFSIFVRASEMPVFRIEKDPAMRRKQGQYRVLGQNGQVLKRGHELVQVLKVLDSDLRLVR